MSAHRDRTPAEDTPADAPTADDNSTDDASTIERTLSLVGDRWSILVLRAAFRGIRRFDDFCADLGIARPILTARLRKLVDAGVMTKERYQERPPRYEYRLTPMGTALSPAIVALVRWGDEHLSAGRPATMLVHAPCGTELEQGFWCRSCATTFGPSAIRGVPAPDSA
ncbi:MAG: winged helix-turn-helix transcriptional regulator [Acidimicrobiia bacterium]